MTGRLAFVSTLVVTLILAVSPAAAGAGALVVITPGRSHVDIPANLTGELTVSFHGPAYEGTVVVLPGSGADVVVDRRGRGRHASYHAELLLGAVNSTTSSVERAGAGTGAGLCADEQQPSATVRGRIKDGQVTIPLLQSGQTLLATRCAGPLDGDVSSAAPKIELPLAQLLRGQRTLDLHGTEHFAASGFTGTVSSTLTVRLGTPGKQPSGGWSGFPKWIKMTRMRQLIESFRATNIGGRLDLTVAGDPVSCEFLDSCSIQGSLSGTIAPRAATAALIVTGPARRPYRDFLAALGLSRRGNPHGLQVGGGLSWSTGGTLTANLQQAQPCSDRAALGGGEIDLRVRGGRLVSAYSAYGPLRTRCPGPVISQDDELARGVIRLRQVARHSFTLRLNGSGPLSDDGYTIAQRTRLTLTLRRARLHTQTFEEPSG